MQLVRTLALAATAAVLCAGHATAQETAGPTSPAPPTAAVPNTSTPAPSTTLAPAATPAPAAPTTAPPSTGSAPSTSATPGVASTPAAEATPDREFTRVQIKSAWPTVVVNVNVGEVEVAASGSDTWKSAVPTKLRVLMNAATTRLEMNTLTSDLVKELEIGSDQTTGQAVLDLPTNGVEGLASLSSLNFTNINLSDANVRLTVPTTLAYLKIHNTNSQDMLLSPSGLNKVDLLGTGFTRLPYFLYQRKYAAALDVNQDLKLGGRVTELSDEEFQNAQYNLKAVSRELLRFETSCGNISTTGTGAGHVVCLDKERTGVRSFGDNAKNPGSASSSFTDAPTGPTPAPTLRGRNSSSNTTLTVIVIVIALVAAVLAYFVARRYFCTASSLSGSPQLNERTVGLISKDESHAANNKLSFISSDDALRQIRLEQQDVSVTKSVGTGRLWVGDFAGRKVMIKRIEAESSDSYATKALITQARALAPLTHPNLVSLVGVTWVQGTDFGVVGEFMDKGTLKAVLMDLDTELDLQSKLHMCLDIAQALKYLHSRERNMYMNRLTSRKVLVNGAVECKLNLYECHPCTTKIEYPEVFGAGEMAWLAPELITRTGVLDPRKINIFSLGVLIGEIMTRASPYQSAVDAVGHTLADLELLKRIKRQERLLPHENRHEFTELPAVLRDLVDRCLSYQPLSRPTADEIVQCLESVKDYSERVGSTTSL